MWNKIERVAIIAGWLILATIFFGTVYAAIEGIA